jgi:hypothetical protein
MTRTADLRLRGGVGIAVQTRLLVHWSEIAVKQEIEAVAARAQLEATRDETLAAGRGLELTRELHPSMTAISACAHALDALYGEIAGLALPQATVDAWAPPGRGGPPRPRKINEALKHGFRLRPAGRFQARLDTLFNLRDDAVHAETGFAAPTPHPLGVHVAREYQLYRLEQVHAALDLLMEILETCVERPRVALEPWSQEFRPQFERLSRIRNPDSGQTAT